LATSFFIPVQDGIKEVEGRMRAQADGSSHPDMRAALEHLMLAGGKRVRPTLVMLVGNMIGADH
jgi:geranylgeranyl pyrophosphate synthase